MPAVIAAILGFLGKFLTDKLLFFVATKTLLTLLFVVVLPIIIKNIIIWLLTEIHTFMSLHLQTNGIDPFILQLSGVGAYLGNHFQLPLCVAILISAVLFRVTLNFIPFVK